MLWRTCVLSLLLVLAGAARAADEEPPFTLTDPGGQGLTLEKLEVRLAAHGPLALTELDMTFRNPLDRRIEGKLVCALPPGATVSRFAKDVDGRLMEGEVVERLRATQVYTEILHTMQDPALLEQDQGNRFRARIFPIGPKAAVRVLLSYTSLHPVAGDGQRRITVPLRGMSKIGHLKLLAVCRPLPGEAVQLADASGEIRPILPGDRITFAEELERKDFTPREDLVLAFRPGADAKPATRLVAGDFQIAMFRPPAPPAPEAAAKPASVRVLIDTSASQAGSGTARIQALARVLALLGEAHAGAPIAVDAFDLDVAPLFEYSKSVDVSKSLETRRFLGATDLAKALKHAGEKAREAKGPALIVLVTDGIATLGTKETGDLVRALGEWPATASLHVLAIGPVQDASVTSALAEAGHGRVVTLPLTTAWEENAKRAVAELGRPRGPDFQAYDEAAEWIEPKRFPDAVPGAELIAFSRRKPGASAEVGVTAGKGTEQRAAAEPLQAPEFAPLLEREAYARQLALLEREENATTDKDKRAELRKKRVEISTKHRVLCPLTSMLVLESEGEYRRYGIDRRALADVMVVGSKGIELMKREPPKTVENVEPARPERVRAAGKAKRALDADNRRNLTASNFSLEVDREFDPHTQLHSQVEAAPEGAASEAQERAVSPAEAPADAPLPEPMATGPQSIGRSRNMAPPRQRGSFSNGFGAGGAPAPAPPAMLAPPPPQAPPAPVRGAERGDSDRRERDRADRPRTDTLTREVQEEDFRSTIRAPAQPPRKPVWTEQAAAKPTTAGLDALRKKVEAQPLDRAARNALAFALDRARQNDEARDHAFAWQRADPDNPMVYEYAGNAFTRMKDAASALRAYSSIAEVSPGESGLLNRAGFLALKAGQAAMAETLFRFAIERRPDHANNHRGLALALWTQGRHEDAVKALADALARDYHNRYGDLPRVLREEMGYILGSWTDTARAAELAQKHRVDLKRADALRITLHWETDANDVDLHVVDPSGEECFYSHRNNASGLTLYEDLTQGLGPEVAVVPPGQLAKGAYHVGVNYFAAGPMGVSRGVVVIQNPPRDGKPDLQIETFCLLPDVESGKDLRHIAVVER